MLFCSILLNLLTRGPFQTDMEAAWLVFELTRFVASRWDLDTLEGEILLLTERVYTGS